MNEQTWQMYGINHFYWDGLIGQLPAKHPIIQQVTLLHLLDFTLRT